MREVCLVVCKCGRIKKFGKWEKMRKSVSTFLEIVIRYEVSSIDFLIDDCPDCKMGGHR